jgi:hypothetical protein
MGVSSSGMTLTSNAAQKTAYESLSNKALVATILDRALTWEMARDEINENRPIKSGVEGHARVCAGWLEEPPASVAQRPRRWLRLYDPQPSDPDPCVGGKTTWEKWTTVTHTNFIFVRHA